MRQYVCRNQRTGAQYTSLSVFSDLFGDVYTKPLYVEKVPSTFSLEGRCQIKYLLGKAFYSLIKTPDGTYRLNSDIYSDAHTLLGLRLEHQPTLAFGLMRAHLSEIVTAFSPTEAYVRARSESSVLRSVASFVLQQLTLPEECLGLIGSLGIDPTVHARDVDLVFSGPVEMLDLAYHWVRDRSSNGPPLRRAIPPPLPTVCAFFSAVPSAYPDSSDFCLLQPSLQYFDVLVGTPQTPPYLNLQIYFAELPAAQGQTSLILRDTLSRAALMPGVHLRVLGYPSLLRDRPAILVTDVEQQIVGVSFHGGGTRCD